MKQRLSVQILNLFVLGLILFFQVQPSSGAEEPIVLKASGAWPQTSESTAVFFKFFDMIKERSKGKLEIKWVGGPEFVKERDLPTAAASGIIDIMQCSQGYLAGSVPEGAIADAYPIGRSYQTAAEAYYDILKIVSPIYEQKLQIKPIGQALFFPFFLFTKQPVKTMQDLKGRKIRGHGGLVPFLISELGASPTTTATTEVYVSMERGLIDGAARNLAAYNSFKEYELAPYGLSLPLTWATADIFISKRAWDRLPKNFQELLWETGKDITKYDAEYWQNMDRAFMERFSQQKVSFADPSPDMKKAWLEAVNVGAKKGAQQLSPNNAPAITAIFQKYER